MPSYFTLLIWTISATQNFIYKSSGHNWTRWNRAWAWSFRKVEKVTVSLNLAMISGLLVVLMVYNGQLLNSAQWRLNNLPVVISDDLKLY